MIIRSIKIENIRGISSKEISVNIHPNTPTFFVAPNGFGKTSIATAFKSIKPSKLSVDEENLYKNDASKEPLLQLTDDNHDTFSANSTRNTISDTFDTFVINSQVRPKASSRSFGGFSTASSSLIVDPIIVCNSIPDPTEFIYSFATIKSFYGQSFGKLLYNLTDSLKKVAFVQRIGIHIDDFLKLAQKRNQQQICTFISLVNSHIGTKNSLLSQGIDTSCIKRNLTIQKLLNSYSDLFPALTELEQIVNLIQIGKIVKDNQSLLSHIFKRYNYLFEKHSIDEMLGFFNCTWKNIRATQKDGKLIVVFPKANQISNGERDVLCFISKLFETKSKLKKDHCILIIDEIFDYLDDANLIATQYFLTKYIAAFKSNGKELYPIILTHLDPMYFNTYCFSTKNVVYLYEGVSTTNKYKINELLKDRDNCRKHNKDKYDNISTYYLHYSPVIYDESEYLSGLRVEEPLLTSNSFYEKGLEELKKYKNNEDYDIALTCCGLRIYIEKSIFEKLPDEHKSTYLSIHKTVDKLSFAKDIGIEVPEVYFLLSIIYNEGMHLDPQCKKLKPIACKLNNKVIKNMISEI